MIACAVKRDTCVVCVFVEAYIYIYICAVRRVKGARDVVFVRWSIQG